MKKIVWQAGLILSVTGAFLSGSSLKDGFGKAQSGITGRVSPTDGAIAVWALNGSDSVSAKINEGAFVVAVKPGTYKLIIDAKDPVKDVILENIEVTDKSIDVGEIVLQ